MYAHTQIKMKKANNNFILLESSFKLGELGKGLVPHRAHLEHCDVDHSLYTNTLMLLAGNFRGVCYVVGGLLLRQSPSL